MINKYQAAQVIFLIHEIRQVADKTIRGPAKTTPDTGVTWDHTHPGPGH